MEIDTRLDSSLLNIMGSPIHLSKTVMNVISNSAEAMPDGGTIHLSRENKYIDQSISGYDDAKEQRWILH